MQAAAAPPMSLSMQRVMSIFDGVNDEVYTYDYKKKKRSWGRSKTTITENRDVTLNEIGRAHV